MGENVRDTLRINSNGIKVPFLYSLLKPKFWIFLHKDCPNWKWQPLWEVQFWKFKRIAERIASSKSSYICSGKCSNFFKHANIMMEIMLPVLSQDEVWRGIVKKFLCLYTVFYNILIIFSVYWLALGSISERTVALIEHFDSDRKLHQWSLFLEKIKKAAKILYKIFF